jgi:hypothetical protein
LGDAAKILPYTIIFVQVYDIILVITEISSSTSHANGYRNTTFPNTY